MNERTGTDMPFLWMIITGLIAGAIAKLLMPERDTAGLLVLGIGGSILAGGIQYSESLPMSFIAYAGGAAALLFVYRITASRPVPQKIAMRDDFRRAA
jgi:uncharacterized membrane protein YeaQ/YmgE (transglycosylase-associated protein family)